MQDSLQRLVFEHGTVRAQAVNIQQAWQQVRSNNQVPEPVAQLLGQMVAASTLLSANIKFNGALVLQIQGDGPVRLIVVECHADLTLRATVKMRENAVIAPDATLQSLVNQTGQGRCVVVLDPKDKVPGQQPYQGIVPLQGDTIAQVLEHYMMTSEQLDTRIWLACDEQAAGGILLQKLPLTGGQGVNPEHVQTHLDDWERAIALAQTIKPEEMTQLQANVLLHRLYWEETARHFEAQPVQFRCTCSREKVGKALLMLGAVEVKAALEEQGSLQAHCDFCGKNYQFDAVDAAELFRTADAKHQQHLEPTQATKH